MTSDTAMLRVSKTLVPSLKALAQQEGRTLEWCASDAVAFYLQHYEAIQQKKAAEAKRQVTQEPQYTPLEQTA